MLIGICYDLREDYLAMGYGPEEIAELDKPETIDGIDSALQELGHTTVRIGHLRSLVGRLARGERWDLVFNICEGLVGYGREAVVPAVLEAYAIPYTFSDPLVLTTGLHKGFCKALVRQLGLPTPDFAVINSEDEAAAVSLPVPLFAKPVAEGSGKGVHPGSRILSRETLVPTCRDLLTRFRQPVLVERYLSGREFTVGVVGTGSDAVALGTLEVVLLPGADAGMYSYRNKEEYEQVVTYALVPADDPVARECERITLGVWRGLGCRDAGRVDLRADDSGQPHFLEINALAGLNLKHSDLPILGRHVGVSYTELIRRIVESASRRIVV
jgi:D-alanine-D-alanine ligase